MSPTTPDEEDRSLLPRERRFIVGSTIDAVGTGAFFSSIVVLYVTAVGLTPVQVGLGMALSGLVGLVLSVPVSRLGDRWSPVDVLIAVQFVRATAVGGVLLVDGFASFLVVMAVLGAFERPSAPLTQASVLRVAGRERRMLMLSTLRVARNIGLGLGTLLGVAVLLAPSRTALLLVVLINVVSFTAYAVALLSLRRADATRAPVGKRPWVAVKDARFLGMAACNGVFTFHGTALEVGLPLLLVGTWAGYTWLAPAALAINMALVVAFQRRAARIVERDWSPVRSVTVGGTAIALGSLALLAAQTTAWGAVLVVAILAAVIAMSIGELVQSSSSWVITNTYGSDDHRAEYIGTFSLGNTSQQIIGPLAIAAIASAAAGWVAVTVVVVLVTLAYRLLLRAPLTEPEPTPAAGSVAADR